VGTFELELVEVAMLSGSTISDILAWRNIEVSHAGLHQKS
jgi:hypothetical protein